MATETVFLLSRAVRLLCPFTVSVIMQIPPKSRYSLYGAGKLWFTVQRPTTILLDAGRYYC